MADVAGVADDIKMIISSSNSGNLNIMTDINYCGCGGRGGQGGRC
jgi:hypothetical protein